MRLSAYSMSTLPVTACFCFRPESSLTTDEAFWDRSEVARIVNIISVQSFKGGTGKSTISANLAVTLAQLGKRVGVVDLDLEGPDLPVISGVSAPQLPPPIN